MLGYYEHAQIIGDSPAQAQQRHEPSSPNSIFMGERILAVLHDIKAEFAALPEKMVAAVIAGLAQAPVLLVPVLGSAAGPDIPCAPPEPAAHVSELAVAVHARTTDPATVAATAGLRGSGLQRCLTPGPGAGAGGSGAAGLGRGAGRGAGVGAPGARAAGDGDGANRICGAGCCNPHSSAKAAANSSHRVPGAA